MIKVLKSAIFALPPIHRGGGLNFQIEHHLFPGICHVHYRKLAAIVKKTTGEFGIPYHVQPGFMKALKEHARMLKARGEKPFAASLREIERVSKKQATVILVNFCICVIIDYN